MRRPCRNNQISFGCMVTNPVFAALSMRSECGVAYSQPVLLFLFCIQMFGTSFRCSSACAQYHHMAICEEAHQTYASYFVLQNTHTHIYLYKGYENRFSHSAAFCFHRHRGGSQRCHRYYSFVAISRVIFALFLSACSLRRWFSITKRQKEIDRFFFAAARVCSPLLPPLQRETSKMKYPSRSHCNMRNVVLFPRHPMWNACAPDVHFVS